VELPWELCGTHFRRVVHTVKKTLYLPKEMAFPITIVNKARKARSKAAPRLLETPATP